MYQYTPFTPLNLLGRSNFKTYQESILHSRKIALTAPIKRNKLKINKGTKVKKEVGFETKSRSFQTAS